LLRAQRYDEILKVESKYCHLDIFNDDPVEDVRVLYAFGCAHDVNSQDEICCMERAIDYFERAKERLDANAHHLRKTPNLKTETGMNLVGLYSEGRDMDKAISSHRWLLEKCNRHEVTANHVINISHNFNQFKRFEYTIEVLEGSMDMMETVEDEL
jgi:hypothetical protein